MINNLPIIGIYKIISPSGKIYIGQSIDIENRWKRYINNNCKTQPKLYNSLKKYGWDKHIKEILEECLIEHLNIRETFYKVENLKICGWDWDRVLFCGLYDSGGGPKSDEIRHKMRKPKRQGSGIGKKHSEETKLKMSQKRYTEEQKQKMRKPHIEGTGDKISQSLKGKPKSPQFIKNISKPVLQYNLKGELIKEWESISHANISLNKPPNASSISLCIMGKYKKAFGFVWKFKDETTPTTKIKTNHFNIIQLTLDGDFIAEYENATTASKKIGINSGSIWFCLNGKHKSAGGFIWKYKIDIESYE